MFRAHPNKRLFFTLPSLAFFDGTHFRSNKRISITPGTFRDVLCQVMKEDWRIVPQPRPASSTTLLFVNSSNKVTGRLRPPLCVPFPKGTMGAGGGLTRDALLDYVDRHDGTWFVACTQRAVGTAIVNKSGVIEDGTMRSFSLLKTDFAGTAQHQRGAAEYDSPGFIRPGAESPLYQEFFGWMAERLPQLERCSNWVARRDDDGHYTWDQLKMVLRDYERENRFEAHNAAVAEEQSMLGEAGAASPTEESASSLLKKYKRPEDETQEMFGGHASWTPEGAAAASQFSVERRAILDHPKWIIASPSHIPMGELTNPRTPNTVNVLGGVGRLRMGMIEMI